MTQIEQIIAMLYNQESVNVKGQFIGYLTNMASQTTIGKKDRDALNTLLEQELVFLKTAFAGATSYREKNDLIGYANGMMELTLTLYKDPSRVPQSLLGALSQIATIIREVRFLENAVEELFEGDATPEDVAGLEKTLATVTDEFQRGLFWSGLLHYAEKLPSFSQDALDAVTALMVKEFARLFTLDMTPDVCGAIEVACDAAQYNPREDSIALLYQALTLESSAIRYFATVSLLSLGKEVAPTVIASLATDLEYACLIHEALEQNGKSDLFPDELKSAEYLAKSDLVHWLVYPTELGKKPDEIEYIGTVTVEKIPYYIFRFKSNSDNLDDEAKGKWLIGWSAAEGNTFSEFELYEDYEDSTVEKTLKNIKKKILY